MCGNGYVNYVCITLHLMYTRIRRYTQEYAWYYFFVSVERLHDKGTHVHLS